MTTFVVAALIALALKVTLQALETIMPAIATQRSIVRIAAAIATAYALSYSVFAKSGFDVALRNHDVEKVVTGIALAGLVTVWSTVLSYLGTKEEESTSATTHRLAA